MYNDDISKDKAYNYDYIIGQGVDKVESKGAAAPNNVLPFMNNIAEESSWVTTPASVVYPPQQPQVNPLQQDNKFDDKQYERSYMHDYQDYQDNYDYDSYNYDNYGGPQVPSQDHQRFKKQDTVSELRPTSGFQPMYPYESSDYSKQDMYGYAQSPATPSTTTTQQTTWQDAAAPGADFWSAPRSERGSSSYTERSVVNPTSYSPAVNQPSFTEKSVAIPQEPRWQDLQKQQPEYPRRRSNQDVKTKPVESERQTGYFSDNKEDLDKKFPHFPALSGNGLDSYDIPKLDAIPASTTVATEDLKSERRSLPDTFSDYSNTDYVTSRAINNYNTNNYGASRRSQSSSYDSFFDNAATNFGGYGRDTHTEKARSSNYAASQNNYQAPYQKDLVKDAILPKQNNYVNDLQGFTSPPADFTSFPVGGGIADNPFFDEAMDMFSDWGQKITDKDSSKESQPQQQQSLQRQPQPLQPIQRQPQPQPIYTTPRPIVTTTIAPAVYEKFEQKFVDKRRVVPGQYNVFNPLNYGPTARPVAVTTTTPKTSPTAAYSYFSQSTPAFNHNERSYHVYDKDFIDQSKNDFYSATKSPYNPAPIIEATTTTTTERPNPFAPNNNSPLGGYAMPEAPKNFFGTPEPQRNYFGTTPTPGSYQNNAANLVGFGTSPQPQLSYRDPITTPQPSYYKPQEDQNKGIKRNINYATTAKPEYFGGSPTPSSINGGQYFGGSPTPNYLTGTSKPLNNYAQTSPKPSIDYIPASPTPYNNYYAGGSPTPKSDYYSGGSPTPKNNYYYGGSPSPKNNYISKSDNFFAGTPAPKKALFASPTPKSYLSGSTTPPSSYFGGSPTPKNAYYGGSPTPKNNYYSGGSPSPRTYNSGNDWSSNKFLGSKQVSSQVTVAPNSYPAEDNPYVISSRRDQPSKNDFFSDSSNFQGFNAEDIGFGAGFPSFFSASNRLAPAEDMSGVDDSQVAPIKKPYQPALTFLSQEQFDDNDGMYENKFKHRSSDAVLPDPVDIPKLEGKSIVPTSTEQLPPLVSSARTTIKSFVDQHKDLQHSSQMEKSTESSEKAEPKKRLRIPPNRMKSHSSSEDKSTIRMRLTKSKSRPTPSRNHHNENNKPAPRKTQISKNNRFPNFKEIEQNVKQSSQEVMRSKPFLSQPQRRRDNPAAAPPPPSSGSTRPRFSMRKAPQQQPRGLKPGVGQQQSRGILGQGGLLSKLFSRRSRKLDMEGAESETSETEILKLSASEISESNSNNTEDVLPFLDEQ